MRHDPSGGAPTLAEFCRTIVPSNSACIGEPPFTAETDSLILCITRHCLPLAANFGEHCQLYQFQFHCWSLVTKGYWAAIKVMLPKWAPSSEFVSSSIPSWQILTAHAQPFRRARDLAFCLKVPLDSLLVWASSGGSGETAQMRRLAWTFAARICDKYQIRLTRSKLSSVATNGTSQY